MRWLKPLAHFVWGALTSFMTMVDPSLAAIMASSFIAYEIVEKWSKGDRGYPEIRQFIYGVALGATAALVKSLVLAP